MPLTQSIGWVGWRDVTRTCWFSGRSGFDRRLDHKSRMRREPPVRIREGPGVKFPRATRLVILCRSCEEAERAPRLVQDWTASAGLSLHPTKTRLVDVREEGFTFPGYTFSTSKDGQIRRWPGQKALRKFKETIRAKTRRNRGESLRRIIVDVNESLRGWFGYFKHSYTTTFPYLDGLIRRRLRNILRKRQGGRGVGNGPSHRRWPNAYFTERGLFSLETAHRLARQPPSG